MTIGRCGCFVVGASRCPGEYWGAISPNPYCFQVQPVTSVEIFRCSFMILGVYSIDSSGTICKFPEVLELPPVISQTQLHYSSFINSTNSSITSAHFLFSFILFLTDGQ
jgi:hypothetical protein